MKGDYANGRIYKIEPICDHEENEVYFGSTCQILCKRMDIHRSGYKRWKDGKGHKINSYELFEKYDVVNCIIHLVELYPCETKEQLLSREGHYIKNNQCVNRNVAGRTRQQYIFEHKHDAIIKKKDYYNENCEMIKQRSNNYRQKNIEKISTKYNCECGGKYTHENKQKHLKTTKHIELQMTKKL